MTTRNLDALFKPRSVAIVGATERTGAVGAAIARNALASPFKGALHFVNRKGGAIFGRRAFRALADIPGGVDLAVIATPADTVPGLVAELGRAGGRAAVVVTAGFGEGAGRPGDDGQGAVRRQAMLDAAQPRILRVVGPNCIGFIAPPLGLNASFAPAMPKPGNLAFVGQSGAVLTAVIDWAAERDIGFTSLVSMGDMADVDFGDVLDALAQDADTRAVLLYIEGITHARKFMSAARALARLKPVVVLKSGRHAEAARAAASHTGAMAGSDAVYDAAFRRAGLLRAYSLAELFDAASTLALAKPPRGEALAIVSNGGGVGVIATDSLMERRGRLARLGPETIAALDRVLPPTWSRANPVDLIGDADGARYAAAVRAVADDDEAGAILVLNAPTALASPLEAARAVVETRVHETKPVLASWLGGAAARQGRAVFQAAGIPSYETPGQAVRGFMHLVDRARLQRKLMETPRALEGEDDADVPKARAIVSAALAEGRALLTEPEAKGVLAAFGIPVVPTVVAADADAAADAAERLGFPVAVKILSRDITHKSDVGGVSLDLGSAAIVRAAADAMRRRVGAARPGARIDGFVVQPMVRRRGAFELILGAAEDATFGPIVLFGQGGTAAEVLGDSVVALPPLNLALADAAMAATRVDRLLRGYRDRPPADRAAVAGALVRLSRLLAEIDEIAELDVNPLLADAEGVVALDARIVLAPRAPGAERAWRFAIRPYPSELEAAFEHEGRRYAIRPIRPEDEPALQGFVSAMSAEDIRMRFFAPIRGLSHEMAARLSQIDYDREMAFVLLEDTGERPLAGVVRLAADPSFETGEFAIALGAAYKGRGLGHMMMDRIELYARRRGMKSVFGHVLEDNAAMLRLAKARGYALKGTAEQPSILRVEKAL
jgi:acetyltransferase